MSKNPKRFLDIIPYFAGIVVIGIIWQICSMIMSGLPGFQELFGKLLYIWQQLILHIFASLARIAVSSVLCLAVSFPLAVLAVKDSKLDTILSGFSYIFLPIPKIIFLPVIFVLLGTGEASRIFLLSLILYFQLFVSIRDSINQGKDTINVSLDILGAGFWSKILYKDVPSSLSGIFTGFRLGLGSLFTVLVFSETFFTDYGLGFFIIDSWLKLDYQSMVLGILSTGFLGIILFFLIDILQKILCPWQFSPKINR